MAGAGRTLLVITLGAFVTALDNTIVAGGAAGTARALGLDLAGVQWVGIGYVLPFASLLLVAGAVVDRCGVRRALTGGLGGFGVAALAAGLAPTAGVLITARVAQGAAAAVVVPALLSLLRTQLDARRRELAGTLWLAALAVALALGPTLGGLLAQYLGWGWVFFVNLPFVLVMLLTLPRASAPVAPTVARSGAPPVVGMVLAAGGTGLVTAATVGVGAGGAGAGGAAWPLGLAGLGVLVGFAARERRARTRLVPAELVARGTFVRALVVQLLWGLGVTGVFFFTPLVHQDALGLDPARAGLPLLLVALAVVAATPTVPAAVRRFGVARVVAAGLTAVAAGLVGIALVGAAPAILPRAPGLLLAGVGSAFTAPLTTGALEAVPSRLAATASGLLTASREVSGALGVALVGAVLAAVRTARLAAGAPPGTALAAGYTAGLLVAAALQLLAAGLALRLLRVPATDRVGELVPE